MQITHQDRKGQDLVGAALSGLEGTPQPRELALASQIEEESESKARASLLFAYKDRESLESNLYQTCRVSR